MGFQKLYKRVSQDSNNNLTENQKDIIYYLIDERLTSKQIANIKGTSVQAVNKTIRKLKDSGIIKEVSRNAYFRGGSYPVQLIGSDKEYRLHAQSFIIYIQESSSFYRKLLKDSNRDTLDNNSLMLYEDRIVIYGNKDFWGNSVNQCIRLSLDYWSGYITRLENHYKVWLIKGQRLRLREFRGEIAKVGDPIAKEVNAGEDKFSVYDNKGIRRLIIDKSFKFDELEAVNKDSYSEDMQLVTRRYRDWLENDSLMLDSEVQRLLQYQMKLLTQSLELQRNNAQIIENLIKEVERLKER